MRALLLTAAIGCAASTPRPAVICGGPQAEAVAEIDVARLRGNEVVAPVLARLQFPVDAKVVDAVTIAFYRVGTPDAATVFWLRGPDLDARALAATLEEAEALEDHLLAIGPASRRACGAGLAAPLLGLRGHAEPKGAPGTSARLYGILSVAARVELARLAGVEDFPARLSIWIDVVDDAALVAVVDRDVALGRRLSALRVGKVRDEGLKLVWVIGPRELRALLEKVP